jgi:hypothetical protein
MGLEYAAGSLLYQFAIGYYRGCDFGKGTRFRRTFKATKGSPVASKCFIARDFASRQTNKIRTSDLKNKCSINLDNCVEP